MHYDAQLYGRTLQNKQQALQAALGGADDVRRYQVQMQLTPHMPSALVIEATHTGSSQSAGVIAPHIRSGVFARLASSCCTVDVLLHVLNACDTMSIIRRSSARTWMQSAAASGRGCSAAPTARSTCTPGWTSGITTT